MPILYPLLSHKKLKWNCVVWNPYVTVTRTSPLQNGCPLVIVSDLKIDLLCFFRVQWPNILRCFMWHRQYEIMPCAATDIQAVSPVLQLAWPYQSSCCLSGEYCARHKWLSRIPVFEGVMFCEVLDIQIWHCSNPNVCQEQGDLIHKKIRNL